MSTARLTANQLELLTDVATKPEMFVRIHLWSLGTNGSSS
jgi:hypothetical protein